MVNRFNLKPIFESMELAQVIERFGFRRMTQEEIEKLIQSAFSDYILSALSELGDGAEDKSRIYLEAQHHIGRASQLLAGMPHPAGKMSFRLDKMTETLTKLIEGDHELAASRANRFMEKNLVRRLRDLWQGNTATPFYACGDDSGRNPRDFIPTCFRSAAEKYPEIQWFAEVDSVIADQLIKGIKR